MDVKQVLINQIIEEVITKCEIVTLDKVVSCLTNEMSLKLLNDKFSEIYENSRPDFELKSNMRIKAKRKLRAKSCNWNSPETIDVPVGAILEVFDTANNGDVFAYLVEGDCIIHSKDYLSNVTPEDFKPNENVKHNALRRRLILVEGQKSRHPNDFGLADKNYWEKLA